MTRLRITLLLLALGIALPTGLILQRALTSLELESAVQHEAVAERIFDEMERTLSSFIVREEARPAAAYASASAAAFADADEPFVVGWFTVDASGLSRIVHAAGDAQRVERAISSAWAGANAGLENGLEAAAAPAPGRTQALGKKRAYAERKGEEQEGAGYAQNAYEVFQSLNRAQQLRSERQTKASRQGTPPPRTAAAPASKMAARRARSAESTGSAAPEPAVVAQLEESAAQAADSLGADLRDLEGLGYQLDDADASARDERIDAVGRVALPSHLGVDPLIGHSSADGSLVLARSVWSGGNAQRQGIVVDRDGLGAWLETRVLASSGLGDRARIDFGAAPLAARAAAEHRYLHRFAEPFDGVIARLDLEPLPGVGSARPIYALALLLAVVGTVGLFAVHRMTKVVVDFAQRRSDFVASVSHELKTPLTAIRMYGEMLRDGLVPGEAKRDDYYATITDEAERLSRLIDNVLEFSKLEQDRRNLDLVVGSLPEALRGVVDKLRTHAEREGFALRLEIDEGLPPVRYDPDALTQLVFNLVDNALKYARNAELREIAIALRRSEGHIVLSVRDFGPGVPGPHLRRVFEPFYRGGDELTRTARGTGIGLALVKELGEAMGASVRGDNPPGGGFEVAVAFEASR